jgi:predicted transcriptional regulator
MSEEIKMTIRLPPELHARLGRAAMRDRRSKHAQMLAYIERGITQDDRKAARSRSGRETDGTQEH